MKELFVGLLFSNAVFAFTLSLVALQRKAKDDKMEFILFFFTLSSSIWSLGSGILVISNTDRLSHFARSTDLAGTVGFMITIIMILGYIASTNGKIIQKLVYFSELGIILFAFSLFPNAFTFSQSKWGTSFAFTSPIYGTIYTVFFVFCSLAMLYEIIEIHKGDSKSKKFFSTCFLLVLVIILLGSFTDMILPLFGKPSAPGSSIAQFWGLLIVWYACDHISHSRLTVKNMSTKIYDALSTPIIMATKAGNVMVVNDAAKEFFQLPDESGKDGFCMIYELFDLPTETKITEDTKFVTFDALCKKNNVYCNIRSNTAYDFFKEPIGYISIITDLTNQLEARQKLEEAKQEAIDANKAKSLFLANMSHEIRTPVNAIMGFSEIALSEELTPQLREYFTDIKTASNTLLSSINDILNISKIESGKMEIVNEAYFIKPLLKNVAKIISVQAAGKDLAFSSSISGYVPVKLIGDDVRIQEILINLLNNSVKYTQYGKVSLEVHGERISDKFVNLSFYIRDTGIGIKPEDIDNLFTAYERMDSKKNHRTEGTGLGLSIVNGYVNLMGGVIEVNSEYGKGSEFVVKLIQEIVDPSELSLSDLSKNDKKTSELGGFKIKNTRILTVDDNKVNLKVISKTLEKYGLQVDTANSGKDAIRMCKETRYPLVLMDHMMPDMDGLETMEMLRKEIEYYRTEAKIVVLTANAVDGVKKELIDAGFDDYLAKPIIYSELEKVLKQYIPEENFEIG